jgi:hypothetical protein
MPLFEGDLQPNAFVDVYTLSATRDSSGGTVEAYTTLAASNVAVLISQGSGSRDGRFEGRLNTQRGVATGEHVSLGSQKMRLVVRNSAPATVEVPWVAGKSLYAESISKHLGSSTDEIPPRYTVSWELYEGG